MTPQTEEQMVAALKASIAAAKRAKREEFSCPCCGTPTDSSYCGPCDKVGCGERDVSAPDICLVDAAVAVAKANRVAVAELLAGKSKTDARLAALDALIANVSVPHLRLVPPAPCEVCGLTECAPDCAWAESRMTDSERAERREQSRQDDEARADEVERDMRSEEVPWGGDL